MKCVIGIDIGGTEIKFGKFINDVLTSKFSIKTNISNNGKTIINDLVININKLLAKDELVGVGIGVPGPVVNGTVLGAQNLGWGEIPLKNVLNDYFPNTKICILNDANAATLGEMAFGSAQGYKNFVFVTIGTGIGGGIVINGDIYTGKNGSAGEIGHLRVENTNKRLCTCGLYDCVEQYASATGIVKTAHELINNTSKLYSYNNITCKDVFDCAKNGDDISIKIVTDATDHLATALSQIADVLNPEAFIIGGGVSKAGEFWINMIAKRFEELAFPHVKKVDFAIATLGNDAGIYGACYQVIKDIKNGN